MAKPVIRISQETKDSLLALATERDIELTAAAEMIVAAGLAALDTGNVHPTNGAIQLREDTQDLLRSWAEDAQMTTPDAAHRLITCGIGRLAALAKDRAKKAKK